AARPRLVVLGNLFRDQLDRYGEVDIVADRWREMVAGLDPSATLVYNTDDPLVAAIAERHPRRLGYGVADVAAGREGLAHAAAAATALAIPNVVLAGALSDFRAAFGRVERVSVQGRSVWLFLAKNPVGFNEVQRTIFHDGECRDLLVILNDNEADGRDVSWIW